MSKDPICGMEVDEKKSRERGLFTAKDGKTYYFCSKNCMDKFLGEEKTEAKKKAEKAEIKVSGISIGGMHCASCALTIERALSKVPGVKSANVNFATEKANVEYDPSKVTEEALEKAVEKTGYKVFGKEEKPKAAETGDLRLKVIGMDNPHCVGEVENALKPLKGIEEKELFVNEKAHIKYNPSLVSAEKIKHAIKQAGYEPIEEAELEIDREKIAREKELKKLKWLFISGLILSIIITILSLPAWGFKITFPISDQIINYILFIPQNI